MPQPSDLLIVLARIVEYGGLLLAGGMLLLQRLGSRDPALGWVRFRLPAALAVAFVGGAAVVIGEALAAASTPSPGAIADFLGSGLPGLARLARLVAEGIALQTATLAPALTLPAIVAATLGLAAAGHAAAVRPAWWGIGVDMLHLLTAGIWVGGILALATLRPPGGWRGHEARLLLDRFTPVALVTFLLTVGLGTLRGTQELSALGDLIGSLYGQVLTAKVLLVAAMIPLSVLAWRRKLIAPRIEATVALAVLGAAALLAAHPLPPGRAREAEAETEAAPSPALPRSEDLTLGGEAGQVLVGLSLRPGAPGRNTVLVYLLPLEGQAAAGDLSARLTIAGGSIYVSECGPTCRTGEAEVGGGEPVQVDVAGPKGGTARFQLPALSATNTLDLLDRMRLRMHQLRTYRMDETLGPANPPVRTRYDFQAPDRMRSEVDNGAQLAWIGETQYRREGTTAGWQAEQFGFSAEVPQFVWDVTPAAPLDAARIVGAERVDGVDTQTVSFFTRSGAAPVWFRLWIDGDGLVHRAEMRAQGHFMSHHYYDFDSPFTIEAPSS